VASSAAGAAGEFNDDAGWKEAEKSFGIGPQPPTYKKGGIRLPSLLDLSSTIPPVSLRAKIFNAIFRVSSRVRLRRPSLLSPYDSLTRYALDLRLGSGNLCIRSCTTWTTGTRAGRWA
jgi:hypothetical protein